MSFIEWYEWEKPVISEVTEQRPMNNEYANAWISKLSPVTLKYILGALSRFPGGGYTYAASETV